MDISVTICVINLKSSLCVPNGLLEGSMAHFFYLGLSFYVLSKIW